jgi:hypothetical protein
MPRTGATTNPYAFAFNDPINVSDPTGLDPVDTSGMTPSDAQWVQDHNLQTGEVIYVHDSLSPPWESGAVSKNDGLVRPFAGFNRATQMVKGAVDTYWGLQEIPGRILGTVTGPTADLLLNNGLLKEGCLAVQAGAMANCAARSDTRENRAAAKPFVQGALDVLAALLITEALPEISPSLKGPEAPYVRNANIPGGRSFPAGKFPSLTLPDTVTERVGNFLLRQARGIVAGLPKAERAEALKLYVTRTIPRAARDWGPTLIVDSDTEALIYFSGEGGGPGEGDLVYAIGVNPATSELYVGRVDVNILERLGFGTPGFGPWP